MDAPTQLFHLSPERCSLLVAMSVLQEGYPVNKPLAPESLNECLQEDTSFDGILKAITDVKCEISGIAVSGDILYLNYTNGSPNEARLAQFLMRRIISFCVPPRKKASIRAASGPDVASAKLTEVALETFRKVKERADGKKNSSGEVGELLLFLMIEHYLKAPAIAYKMWYKANASDPVKGSDAIHARYDSSSNELFVYFGESKLHQNKYNGISDAAKSISEYHKEDEDGKIKKNRDIHLVTEIMDLNYAGTQAEKETLIDILCAYLDPVSEDYEKKDSVREVNACLIGWNEKAYAEAHSESTDKREAKFVSLFKEQAESVISLIENSIKANDITELRFHYFILPFKDVTDFQKQCESVFKAMQFTSGGEA